MPRKFVVLTTQRSGSNYFCFWLNNHASVRCHSELFLRKYIGADGFSQYCNSDPFKKLLYRIFGKRFSARVPDNLILGNLIKDFYHSLLYNPGHSGPITDDEDIRLRGHYHPRENPEEDKAVGFKLMYDQLEYYGYLEKLIKEECISVIHLIRNNPLKIYLSRLTRRKRGVAHAVHEANEIKVWVDPKTLSNYLNAIVKNQERMKNIFPANPYLEVTSEDFFANYSEASKKVWGFLGVSQCEVRAPILKKLNPDSAQQIIENYDEIFSILRGTPHECFLD